MNLRIAASIAIISLISVPVMITLAVRGWSREIRQTLPQWRNGIGLAAIALTSLAWFWFVQSGILTLTGFAPLNSSYQIDISVLAKILAMLSIVLAAGWKGKPRWEVLAAAVLLLAFSGPFGYV